jgi:hypothetical protein
MTIFNLRRSPIDRRSSDDERKALDLDYFDNDGTERRAHAERRTQGERRLDWFRVSKWSSVHVDKR